MKMKILNLFKAVTHEPALPVPELGSRAAAVARIAEAERARDAELPLLAEDCRRKRAAVLPAELAWHAAQKAAADAETIYTNRLRQAEDIIQPARDELRQTADARIGASLKRMRLALSLTRLGGRVSDTREFLEDGSLVQDARGIWQKTPVSRKSVPQVSDEESTKTLNTAIRQLEEL